MNMPKSRDIQAKMQEQCRKRSKKIGLNNNITLLFVRRGVYFTDTIGEN